MPEGQRSKVPARYTFSDALLFELNASEFLKVRM